MDKTTPSRWFNLLSWILTLLLAAAMLGFAYWKTQSPSTPPAPAPQAQPTAPSQQTNLPANPNALNVSVLSLPSIERSLTLKTNIPERPRYKVTRHTVLRGDSLFRISKQFNIEPETLLWANYDLLEDDPHSLKPGQELYIPPTDGILYQWQEGDKVEEIAAEYEADLQELITWPGNDLDLTNPAPQEGQWVMIPGGWRESKAIVLPVVASSGSSGSNACGGGGPQGSGFIWPAGSRYLSGNDYFEGHKAIDIAAGEGEPLYASAAGTVIPAASGWNSGYGNYVVIDHNNGYATLYAHMSVIGVTQCQNVYAGQVIGAAGNTGNSFGAHLHFEVRSGGTPINPWSVLQ